MVREKEKGAEEEINLMNVDKKNDSNDSNDNNDSKKNKENAEEKGLKERKYDIENNNTINKFYQQ